MTIKNILNNLLGDSRGIILSTDLMLSLIIITITLGMTADAMDLVTNPLQDYSSRSSMERVAIEATDLLINTPGSPVDWEKYNKSFAISPGLATFDPFTGETKFHVISYNKLSALNKNYNEIMEGKVFPEYMESSITICPLNSALKPIQINEDCLPPESSEIVVVNRTIMCDYHYLNCTINISFNSEDYNLTPKPEEICFHEGHKNRSFFENDAGNQAGSSASNEWICKHFNISAESLNTTDYYLIIETFGGDNGKISWILDRADQINDQETNFYSNPLKINNQIASLMENEKQCVLWLHVKNSKDMGKFNVYLVAAPKNTADEYIKIIYLNPQPCYFILKVWLK